MSAQTQAELGTPGAQLNRLLLHDAYPEYLIATVDDRTAQLFAMTANELVNYPGSGPSALLVGLLLEDFDIITLPAFSINWGDTSLFDTLRFLYINPRPATLALVEQAEAGTISPADLIRLNRMLLEDGLQGKFTSGPLTPELVFILDAYLSNPADAGAIKAFYDKLVIDLNNLITSTPIFAQPNVYFSPAIIAAMAALPADATLITQNRVLLETAYDGMIAKNVLARFVLTDVPNGTTQVNAKTAWNLSQTMPVLGAAPDWKVYFVNDGVLPTKNANGTVTVTPDNHKLLAGDITRAGDITGDNTINLFDYSTFKQNWPGSTPPPLSPASADLNGDGKVNLMDYGLMKSNYGKSGH